MQWLNLEWERYLLKKIRKEKKKKKEKEKLGSWQGGQASCHYFGWNYLAWNEVDLENADFV